MELELGIEYGFCEWKWKFELIAAIQKCNKKR
jgi:hypothetical protein